MKQLTIGRNTPKHSLAPLRKIVDHVRAEVGNTNAITVTATREVLECGHVIPVKQDAFGPTNAVRRRCEQCRKQKQP